METRGTSYGRIFFIPLSLPAKPNSFPETRWSVVLNAQDDDPEALSQICQAYWLPLYTYARRTGLAVEDAEDLTQAFFERLLSNEGLKTIRQEGGKLRSFLLKSLKNFATEQWRQNHSQKRGGGQAIVEMDALNAEERLAFEPSEEVTPETEFDRTWARQLMDRAITRVEAIYQKAGKADVFAALRNQLDTESGQRSYKEIGEVLGISENAARFAAFKLRQRYRDRLREEVLETVTSESEAEEELAYVLQVFASPPA